MDFSNLYIYIYIKIAVQKLIIYNYIVDHIRFIILILNLFSVLSHLYIKVYVSLGYVNEL